MFAVGFRLRVPQVAFIDHRVNGIHACLPAFLMALVLVSCDGPQEVTIRETRALTTRDQPPRLDATSDERFRDTKPSPVKGTVPDGWLAVPATQLRLLNYRFGDSGMGEVYVSLSIGTVPDNVNRWLKQFGQPPVPQDGLSAMRQVAIADTSGIWVETTGDYNPGMGTEPKPGFALAGIVAAWEGRILTLKMIGPAAEVKSAIPTLEAFAKSLQRANGSPAEARPAN